jgi:hypothetical protein
MYEVNIRGYTFIFCDKSFELYNSRKFSVRAKKNYVCLARITPRDNGVRHTILFHRELLGLQLGDGKIVDHINGNPQDNRFENLRIVDSKENQRNRRKRTIGHSPYLGVSKYSKPGYKYKPWRAFIRIDGKPTQIGVYWTEEEAAKARDEFAKKYYGEFAPLNFP